MRFALLIAFAVTCILSCSEHSPVGTEVAANKLDSLSQSPTETILVEDGDKVRFGGVGGVQMSGRLYRPESGEQFPVIIIPPAGNMDDEMHPYTLELARWFQSAGCLVLTYDKAGCGQSKGEWQNETFSNQVAQLQDAVMAVRQFAAADKKNIGIFAAGDAVLHTQYLNAKGKEIAFTIIQDPCLADGQTYFKNYIERESKILGIPQLVSASDLLMDYSLGHITWSEYLEKRKSMESADLKKYWLPAESTSPYWSWWNSVTTMDFAAFGMTPASRCFLLKGNSGLTDPGGWKTVLERTQGDDKEHQLNVEVKELNTDLFALNQRGTPPSELLDAVSEWMNRNKILYYVK